MAEALGAHGKSSRGEILRKAVEALRNVRVAAPERRLDDFPHQMSGGMKQRVIGAIAVSASPKVIIADEPTTALDVTIQLQYLRLLKDIQAETGLAIIFITHDFGIVARMCDRVAVMYAGRIVEQANVRDLFNKPLHQCITWVFFVKFIRRLSLKPWNKRSRLSRIPTKRSGTSSSSRMARRIPTTTRVW